MLMRIGIWRGYSRYESKKQNSFGTIESSASKITKNTKIIKESLDPDLPDPPDPLPLNDYLGEDWDDSEICEGGISDMATFLKENPDATIYEVFFKEFVEGLKKVINGREVSMKKDPLHTCLPYEMLFFTEENLKKLPGMNDSFVKTFLKD